jgi:hypothetical protein
MSGGFGADYSELHATCGIPHSAFRIPHSPARQLARSWQGSFPTSARA